MADACLHEKITSDNGGKYLYCKDCRACWVMKKPDSGLAVWWEPCANPRPVNETGLDELAPDG